MNMKELMSSSRSLIVSRQKSKSLPRWRRNWCYSHCLLRRSTTTHKRRKRLSWLKSKRRWSRRSHQNRVCSVELAWMRKNKRVVQMCRRIQVVCQVCSLDSLRNSQKLHNQVCSLDFNRRRNNHSQACSLDYNRRRSSPSQACSLDFNRRRNNHSLVCSLDYNRRRSSHS